MSRYTGPKCRLCRRESKRLFLKGTRCLGEKCALSRKQAFPGMHGTTRSRPSTFGIQLREKQSLKRTYGLLEKPFKNVLEKARQMEGVTGENMLILLERRLDNVVFRLGMAPSRAAARKLVTSKKVLVDKKLVTFPSFLTVVGTTVSCEMAEISSDYKVPEWLELSKAKKTGKVRSLPVRDQIDLNFNEQLVVEYYSR